MNESIETLMKKEHDAVVRSICEANKGRFKVLTNLEGETHHVAGLFPDILMQDLSGNNLIFIMEVRRNGKIAGCVQQWKTVPKIPAVLYLIVPESDLANAKSITQVVGLQARFGSYKYDPSADKVILKYE